MRTNPRPKVHVGSSFRPPMDEWVPLDMNVESRPSQPSLKPTMEGLETDASALQAQFEQNATHLDEVKQRHLEVLVTAGMLPETGLADTHPERALQWVVQGINGRLNPDGLTIPLFGALPEQVTLQTKITEQNTVVQLSVSDGDAPALVRDLPLPIAAAATLEASFTDGKLHLRW
jgi:hypothetical protein